MCVCVCRVCYVQMMYMYTQFTQYIYISAELNIRCFRVSELTENVVRQPNIFVHESVRTSKKLQTEL